MTPNDIVYNTVYKDCKAANCDELTSKNAAIMALEKYKKNNFTKVSTMMKQAVTDAKKLVAKKKKK